MRIHSSAALSRLRRGDHHGAAQAPAAPSVSVRNGCIEVDGVPCLEHMLLAPHVHAERAVDYVDELDAGMLVGSELVWGDRKKLCVIAVEAALGCRVIERREPIGRLT